MFKLMFVDDDVPMLRYIERLLDWEALGIELIPSAYSSEMALEQYMEQRPDIVVTDIGMPYMNGIELAQELRRIDKNVRVVFLTCHEDFTYSKQAFQLEADDYLIKDELTRDQLKTSLLKAIKQLQNQAIHLESVLYREDLKRNKHILKTELLQRTFSGVNNPNAILSYGRRLGIHWRHPYFRMGVGELRLDDFSVHYGWKDLSLVLYAVVNITEELAEGEYIPFLYDNQIVLLWNGDNRKDHTAAMRIFIEKMMEKAKSILKTA